MKLITIIKGVPLKSLNIDDNCRGNVLLKIQLKVDNFHTKTNILLFNKRCILIMF